MLSDDHFSFPQRLQEVTWAETIKKSDQNSFGGHAAADPKLGPWRLIPVARPQTPRAQMISMYRKEMMDLVRSLPEEEGEEEKDVYELSLRDIVDLPAKKWEGETDAVVVEKERPKKEKRRHKKRSEGTSTAKFLLKAFIPRFPAALGGRQRVAARKGAKVSPKPAAGSDEESSNSEFREKRSSNGNSNGHRGRNKGGMTSCIVLFHRDRTLSMEM